MIFKTDTYTIVEVRRDSFVKEKQSKELRCPGNQGKVRKSERRNKSGKIPGI